MGVLSLLTMTKPTHKKFAGLASVVLCAALAVPALAGAQQVDPTQAQYDDQLTQINGGSAPPAGPGDPGDPGETASGLGGRVGPLPFTGFDVVAMIAVALAVAGLGLALQRAVSRQPSDELS
jgi:hypothetical protein